MSDGKKQLYNIYLNSPKGEGSTPTALIMADAIEDSNMGKSGGRVKLTLGEETVASFDSKRVVGWWIEYDREEPKSDAGQVVDRQVQTRYPASPEEN